MQSLLARREPLRVKHGVDIARENFSHAIALLPRRAEPVGVLAAAEEAGTMPGGQRGGLIEKEQLSPATTGHHLAPLAPELANASKPGPAAPASGQGFSRGIVDDASIAGEDAAMRRSDDIARWSDAILQRHRRPTSRWPKFKQSCSAVADRRWNDSAVSHGKKIQVSC